MKFAEIFKKMNGVRRSDVHWERKPLAGGSLRGKKMAMIGGTNGIGRALARLFAANGADAVVVGRTFRDHGVERLRFIHADLSEMKQAQRMGRNCLQCCRGRESRGRERDRRRCLCRRGMVPERLARLYLFVINLRLRKYSSTSP
jgi:NAD(P)-dependent dehydrogenase (short-subunit alcohol dehydrogenase family)